MNSKPSICKTCGLYYHRTCLKDHSRICAISDSLIGVPSSPSKLPLTPDPHSVRTTSSSILNECSVANPEIMVTDTLEPPACYLIPNPRPPTQLSPTSESFIPQNQDHSNTSSALDRQNIELTHHTLPQSQKRGRQKNKTSIPSDQELSLNFLKRELSTAQARIVEQDAELSDKNKRIEILQARVDSLEESVNTGLYNKYFKPPTVPQPNREHYQTHGPCSSQHNSCPGRPICHPCHITEWQCQCFPQPTITPGQADSSVDVREIQQSICEVKEEMKTIQASNISLSMKIAPPISRDSSSNQGSF